MHEEQGKHGMSSDKNEFEQREMTVISYNGVRGENTDETSRYYNNDQGHTVTVLLG